MNQSENINRKGRIELMFSIGIWGGYYLYCLLFLALALNRALARSVISSKSTSKIKSKILLVTKCIDYSCDSGRLTSTRSGPR